MQASSIKKTEIKQDKKPLENIGLPKCGIIMPISAIENCSAEHWADIQNILREVICDAGFEANLVSDADDSGIIQARIIQNLYNNDIVVCDVSCKNPNVMFELGIRLAFDKPTLIIKDDKTDYTFDTSVIEHLSYPRDLRFNKVVLFKENLKGKIIATHKKAVQDPNYTTFLKHFGEYKIAHLSEKEISSEKFIFKALDEIKISINQIKRSQDVLKIKEFPNFSLPGELSLYSDIENRAMQIVKHHIDEFVKIFGLKNIWELSPMRGKTYEQLLDYLCNNKEVMTVCSKPKDVFKIVEKIFTEPY